MGCGVFFGVCVSFGAFAWSLVWVEFGLCEFWGCVGLRCVGFRGNFRVATLALRLACNVSGLDLLNATIICVDFMAK